MGHTWGGSIGEHIQSTMSQRGEKGSVIFLEPGYFRGEIINKNSIIIHMQVFVCT